MTEVKHKSTRSDPSLSPVCRLIYLWLHEKRTKDGTGKPALFPSYELTMLVPKLHNDPMQCANYKWLSAHCMEACNRQQGWGGFPQGGSWPIQDGDTPPKPKAPAPGQAPIAEDPNKYVFKKGHWVIKANYNFDPGPKICVMQGGQAVEIPARVIAGKVMYKSGDYGHVFLSAYTFHNMQYHKWGVNFGFEGVLFTSEGEAIGGQGGPRAAAAMFGGIAPVAADPTPGAPGPHVPSVPTPGYGAPPHVPAPASGVAPYPSNGAPHHAAPGYVPQNPTPQPPGPVAPPPPLPAVPAHPVPPSLPPFPTR